MERTIGILHDMIQGMSADAEDKGQDTFGITLTHDDARTICHGLIGLKICDSARSATEAIKFHSPYEATVDGMLSPDYKERFKAEYHQTKIRYEKLKAFNTRIEAAHSTSCKGALGVEMPKHDCPDDLLREQQRLMGLYLHILEVRAVIEGIDL